MLLLDHVLPLLLRVVPINGVLAAYSAHFGRGSPRACRYKLRALLSEMRADGFEPELVICLGRGGFFLGSLLTDEMQRRVPLLGMDKAYLASGGSRSSRIEVPDSFVLPPHYQSARTLLVTGEVVDGASMAAAIDFVKKNAGGCVVKTFTLFWRIGSSFKPDYRGYEIKDRQRRVAWKKLAAPGVADYLPGRGTSGVLPAGGQLRQNV